MKNKDLIHFECDNLDQLSAELLEEIDVIRIHPTVPEDKIIAFIEQLTHSVKVLIIDDIMLAEKVKAAGVFFSQPEKFRNFTKSPNFVMGGMAYNLVDCKNWELIGADFVDFNPPKLKRETQPLGSEGFKNLPSKNEEYGWILFSLTIPVYIHQPQSIQKIEEIINHADIEGVLLSKNFNWQEDQITTLRQLRNLFN